MPATRRDAPTSADDARISRERFPQGFVWGAATSAFQVEGAVDADGRGPSIWDTLAAQPDAIAGAGDPAIACDHYHRYPQDALLMKRLGLDAYRFSLSWTRVIPDGLGAINAAGLDFYDRLVDTLLEQGIEPWSTLYHWDLPQPLQDAGGWPARATIDAFLRYADAAARRLGDRVARWFTINEPFCVAVLGYGEGHHAPALKDPAAALAAAHHLLMAHGRAVELVHANVPEAQVGIVLNLTHVTPASPSEADAAEARFVDGLINRWYLDPLYGRGYPEDMLRFHREHGTLSAGEPPFIEAGDLETIATPADLLAVNYYSRAIARGKIPEQDNAPRTVVEPRADERDQMGWEDYPAGLREVLLRLHREYGPERLVISENGAAHADGPDEDGRIRDVRRLRYLHGHLAACHAAIASGVPLVAYFAWSLLDNFEWRHGYIRRFGLVWVDYATQQRLIKDSGHWYARVTRENALLPLPDHAKPSPTEATT